MTRTFAIALALTALFAAGIVALNLAARRADHGAIQVECGTLLPHPGPLALEIDASAEQHTDAIYEAVRAWNRATHARADVSAYPASLFGDRVGTFARALAGHGPEPVGRVLVVSSAVAEYLVADASDTAGHARLHWDPRTCRIGYAVIVLPEADLSADERRVVAEHEIGHVLGLAHDPNPSSVMHHAARAGAEITEYDAALVRARAEEYRQAQSRERDGLSIMEGR